jgi:hypothetical protein
LANDQVAAPGENTKEVMDGAALGLDEAAAGNFLGISWGFHRDFHAIYWSLMVMEIYGGST